MLLPDPNSEQDLPSHRRLRPLSPIRGRGAFSRPSPEALVEALSAAEALPGVRPADVQPTDGLPAGQGLLSLEAENAALKAELAQLKRQVAQQKQLDERLAGENAAAGSSTLITLADTLPIPVYLIDVDRNETLLDNDRMDELLGYAPGQLDRLRRAALVHPEDRGIRDRVLEALRASGDQKVHHSVMRLRHRLGEWRRFHFYDRVLERHPDGSPKRLIGCAECRDATAMQAENRADALERERHMLRRILAAMPQACIMQFDQDGIIQLVEGADLQACGGDPEALIGRAVGSPGLPGHAGRIPEDRYRQCLRGERQQLELHAGESVYALSLIPLYAEPQRASVDPTDALTMLLQGAAPQGRRVIGGLQVLMDISRHVQPQEQLEQQMMDLAEDNETLRQCLTDTRELERSVLSAAHDLKQPIRSIHSFAQLLERRLVMDLKKREPGAEAHVLPADLADCLAFIRQGSKRMEAMVEGMMAFGEASEAAASPDAEPVALNACLENVLHNLAQQIGEKQVQVIYTDLPTVSGFPLDIGKLLQNLVSNAIKFNDKAYPEVVVEAFAEGERWHLTVTDNGIGIPESAQEKVFGLFERLHSKDEYEGAGIGLALCRKIVDRHGGAIWIDSVPGRGTTFHVTLPMHDPARVPVEVMG